jgi:LacI family transcriptional regulator
MATLKDIAERAGVAVSTVSRVLNPSPGVSVSQPVRSRILRAARELDYRPNHYARGLVLGRGAQIPIVFWSAAYQIAWRRLRAVEHSIRRLDHPVFVADADALPPGPEALLDLLTPALPEAVVFVGVPRSAERIGEVVEELQELGVHCVIADIQLDETEDLCCDVVRADREQGMMLAMDHLITLGHREIGLVHWVENAARCGPYEDALEQAGIDSRYMALIETAPTDSEYYALGLSASERVRELLEAQPQITALCCRNDMLALGAVKALDSLGLNVPDDVSVVGFDGDPWTAVLPVPLTTMSSPLAEIADRVTRILDARLAGDLSDWRHDVLPYELVVRRSTKPVNSAFTVRGWRADSSVLRLDDALDRQAGE